METDRGTFIMSSKDMNMIRHIPELCEAGISSLKIEGRMKSAYYAAVTANAYRMALDAYANGKEFDENWERELESVSHRDYSTGYYYDDPMQNANVCDEESLKVGYIREKAYCCIVQSYDENTKLAFCKMRNKLSLNERVEVVSPGKVGQEFVVNKLYSDKMEEIESTPHAQMEFYIECPFELKVGDIIRK